LEFSCCAFGLRDGTATELPHSPWDVTSIATAIDKTIRKLIAVMAPRVLFCLLRGIVLGEPTPILDADVELDAYDL